MVTWREKKISLTKPTKYAFGITIKKKEVTVQVVKCTQVIGN